MWKTPNKTITRRSSRFGNWRGHWATILPATTDGDHIEVLDRSRPVWRQWSRMFGSMSGFLLSRCQADCITCIGMRLNRYRFSFCALQPNYFNNRQLGEKMTDVGKLDWSFKISIPCKAVFFLFDPGPNESHCYVAFSDSPIHALICRYSSSPASPSSLPYPDIL